ncbi:MAG: hypothetical protein JSR73_02890 [Proteobacteria bacterium]|nr:hypothetical protein [Pseudomonadota bacterium]
MTEPEALTEARATALNAALTALQPVVALLLDAGINTNELAYFVRWAAVQEAATRQRSLGKKPSISRIAASTGLTRAEVSGLLDTKIPSASSLELAPRTADKVLAAWQNDPDFLEPNGRPRILSYADSPPSFSDLVHKYAPDIPPRAMLKETIAAGLVAEVASDRFRPSTTPVTQTISEKDALTAFGAKMNALGATLLNNLRASPQRSLYESLVHVAEITDSAVPKVTKELERRCRTFSQSIERYLLDQSLSDENQSQTATDKTIGVIVAIVRNPTK